MRSYLYKKYSWEREWIRCFPTSQQRYGLKAAQDELKAESSLSSEGCKKEQLYTFRSRSKVAVLS